MIRIDTSLLQEIVHMMKYHQPALIEEDVLRIYRNTTSDAVTLRNILGSITFYANCISNQYQLLQRHIDGSIIAYETLETTIHRELGLKYEGVFNGINTDFFHTTFDTHTSLSDQKSLYSYWKNGICAGGSVAFSLVDSSLSHQSKYVKANLSADVLNAKASIDGRIKFSEDGKTFMPALIVSAKGSVALAQIGASTTIGTSRIHADASGSIGIGVAHAEGKAVFSSDEITLKGDVGASALKVSGKGSISIFGVTISVSTSASVGSVGAGFEFSMKKGSLSIGADANLLLGGGIKIDIDY